MTVHFISGLPRAGSTLLSAILSQNPRFSASVTSPVVSLWGGILPKMSGSDEFGTFFDNARRCRILRGVFDAYYGGSACKPVVFDTNRTWTGKLALTQAVYPGSRLICCVRDVGWVLDSIERMLRRNPMQMSRVFGFKPGSSIYGRVDTLMDSEKGLVGLPWSTLREAWFSEHASKMVVVKYENLASRPQETISALYDFLEEREFRHDFENVIYEAAAYDADLGMPGLHTVRERVSLLPRESCLPPDIFSKYAETSFWMKPELNRKGAIIL